mgnify:CR=1 FL=1
MKKITMIVLLISALAFSQSEKKQIAEIKKFQKELNDGYTNKKETNAAKGIHPQRASSFRRAMTSSR